MHKRLAKLVEAQSFDSTTLCNIEDLLRAFSDILIEHETEMEEKEQLQKSLLTLQTLLDTTPEAVFSFRAGGAFEQMNSAAAKFLRLQHVPPDAITAEDTLPALLKQLKKPQDFLDQLDRIASDNRLPLRGLAETLDGKDYEYFSAPKVANGEYVGRIWCWRDISEVRQKDAIIEHQAFHDTLTGLPNRRLLLESLRHAVAVAKRNKTLAAVIFIDLDNFKKINDTAGHNQGDNYLIAVSERIKSCVRSSDLFGRSGGDEFLIVAEDVRHIDEVHATYKRILASFEQELIVGDVSYFASCSIGISIYPEDGDNPDLLIQRADTAMYEAKRRGKNTFALFRPELEVEVQEKLRIESALRKAIDQDMLDVLFQNKVDLTSGQVRLIEAFVRWPMEGGKTLTPHEFIPVAEEAGIVNLISEWVIEKVFSTLEHWPVHAPKRVPVSINLSSLDFQKAGLADFVIKSLKAHKLRGEDIIFEVQESVFLQDISTVKKAFEEMGAQGIRFAIDDFGTGNSSLKYLQLLAFDFIKIDKCFIKGVERTPENAAIAKSIIDIGRALGAVTIAEGVENEQEADWLRRAGCNFAQGYWFGKPLPAESYFTQQQVLPDPIRKGLT